LKEEIRVMKYKLLVLLLFNISLCWSQTLTVDYKFELADDKDEYGFSGFGIVRLITDSSKSISYVKVTDTIVSFKNIGETIQKASEFDFSDPAEYKDLASNEYYSRTIFPKYLLKDNTYMVAWTITENYKEILGYKCQQAVGHYRGRDYTLYFTTAIPIQSGPKRFDGLPGLILEITSNEGAIHYKAIKIQKSNEVIENPFNKLNLLYINWDQFINAYKDYFKRITNYVPEQDTAIIIPKRGVEVFINDNNE
jgi:GLPGLI family protein